MNFLHLKKYLYLPTIYLQSLNLYIIKHFSKFTVTNLIVMFENIFKEFLKVLVKYLNFSFYFLIDLVILFRKKFS